MTLSPGASLGSYEIGAALGTGGMGEVYRATDTRLKRQVAVKVLPPLLASDADRLVRLQREAEVLASLNHPHIAAIYGLEHAGGVTALVMELVDGDDLSVRIARGAIPFDQALPIARQLTDALDAAHERGVVHRDLKPANIKLRPDGTVKVLDFGLAKLEPQDPAGTGTTASPTITSPAMLTAAGLILGTAAYMSPEQARGYAADKRADIWAFGVVVFEMLTGRRLFTGDTISDTLASVLKSEPDWAALPGDVPPRMVALLRWCLAKDPRRRLRDVGDARAQIDEMLSGANDLAANAQPAPRSHRVLPWLTSAALVTALIAVVALWAPWRPAVTSPPLRVSVELGAPVELSALGLDVLALSPDGAVIAFVAHVTENAAPQLYVRRLADLAATALPGTEDASGPFFSPDGKWIGFFAAGKLKKVAVAGGAVVTICDAPLHRGGSWAEDDTIVLLPNRLGGLVRVGAAGGGVPQPLTTPIQGEISHRWPQALPGGKAVLFTSGGTDSSLTGYNDGTLVVQTFAGERTVVQPGGYHGRYVPSGHILYIHDAALFAVPFDLERLTVTGPPAPVLEGIMSNGGTGGAQFAVSASGTFVYVPGPTVSGTGLPIAWLDRTGKTSPLRAARAPWLNLTFAPGGDRIALQVLQRQTDIWVYHPARDTMTAITSGAEADSNPVWTHDGSRIVFASAPANSQIVNIYIQRADGIGSPQRLTDSPNPQRPSSWHPSGKYLAFEETNPNTRADVMILPLQPDPSSGWTAGVPAAFVNSSADERLAAFSPDGKWLAYVSRHTGQEEVYVRSFPGPGGQWQISTGGGMHPTWSRARNELFYSSGTSNSAFRQIWVAPFTTSADTFTADRPRLWSETRFQGRGPNRMFDLHPDGARFAVAPVEEGPGVRALNHFTAIFGLSDELRRLAPAAR